MPQTSSQKKELYLGKCLADLHSKSEVRQLDNQVNIIIRSLSKVFQDAENFDAQGDEERAYIMYMKYFNILKQVKLKADYKNRKEYFENLIGKRNQITAIERAERLSESLKERYILKEAEALAAKLSPLESSSKPNNKTVLTEKPKEKEEEPEEVTPKVPTGFLICRTLHELLRDTITSVVVMDVRPRKDFIQSHISHTDCINVPEEILIPGSTVSDIESKLPDESKSAWAKRRHADLIILLDWKSFLDHSTTGTPLRTLKDAIFQYDTNVIIKSEPLILQGGYEQWLSFYPTMTTNAHVARPSNMDQRKPPSATLTFLSPEVTPKVLTGSITCQSLCELLRDTNSSIVVMDVRPRIDFIQSHISHTDCINVPEDILIPGSTVSHFQAKLPEESSAVWAKRKHANQIILLDWKSSVDYATAGTPLRTLKDAIFKYDMNVIIKSEPLILQGGYEQWLLFYPTMTTNAHVARPSDIDQRKPPSPTLTLDFDYPDFDENGKKSTPLPVAPVSETTPITGGGVFVGAELGTVLFPQFDRSLKPSQSVNISPFSDSSSRAAGALPGGLNEQSTSTVAGSLYPTNLVMAKIPNSINNIISDQVTTSNRNINLSFKNNLAQDFSKSTVQREAKEAELKEFQQSRENTLKEDQQKIIEVEKRLKDLELIKKKEEKDVADLMRMKRKLKEELESEKFRQEEQSKRFIAEETRRLFALEQARKEEEEKRRRLEEVERMRLDRKKGEQLKDLAVIQQEEERKKKKASDIARLIKFEEEREAERLKETERLQDAERLREAEQQREAERLRDAERLREAEQQRAAERLTETALTKKKEQDTKEEEERQRRIERERLKKEEAEKELLRQQYEHDQLKKEAEETKRKLREHEESARLEEEIRRKEQIEKEIKQREEMNRELERQRKAIEKAKLEEASRELARREREASEQLKVNEQQASKMVPSNMLPSGWEKRLDRATNRYFYIDHNLGTTQWTPPMLLSSAGSPDMYTTRLKDEPSVSVSRGLSRSHSSPNIKKQLEEEEERTRNVIPSFDRGIKPSIISAAQTLPKQNAYVVRRRDLNPVYGNVGPALTGLRNLGNTCYMNSTIQCLNNTSPLINYFLNDAYLHDINRESSKGMHGEVVDDFAIVVKALWSQQYKSITPRDLKNTVAKYNPMFAGYQQQDSQEFLTFLLDGLHEGLNEVKHAPDIPEQNNDNLTDSVAAPLAWKHHKLLHKSIIVEMFQGQLKSTLMCRTCKKTSVTFQAFMFLSLPIPASSRCSLKDCIQEFLKPELMTGSSRWKCPRCKVERDSEKKIDLWKLPPILLIGLNRFYSEGMWMQKKTTYVDFPIDDLDLASYIIGPKPRLSYSLYGISNHYGTMEGGHYTAFCRNSVNKKWYKYDDHDVYEMSSSDVKTSAAFVLYYTSIDLPPPQYKPHL